MPSSLLAKVQPYEEDANVQSGYAYPTTTDGVLPIRMPGGTVYHVIFGQGAPSTNYNNAQNGSLYIDTTNFKLYIKTAASTWTVVGSQS